MCVREGDLRHHHFAGGAELDVEAQLVLELPTPEKVDPTTKTINSTPKIVDCTPKTVNCTPKTVTPYQKQLTPRQKHLTTHQKTVTPLGGPRGVRTPGNPLEVGAI